MGRSTDAILAYGFDLGEELPDSLMTSDQDYFDFHEWFRANLFKEPEPDYDTQRDEWREWNARVDAALRACPVDIITHCSSEYPMYFICIRGTELRASRGEPEAINSDLIDSKVQDIEVKTAALQAFCLEYGIAPRWIGWHLFSRWG